MTYYTIERRDTNAQTLDHDCFLGSTMEKVVEWINKNKDFDSTDHNWYWVVIEMVVDYEWGGSIYKVFDRDGNELDEQPIK